MVVYKDPRTIKKVSIPSISDSEVEIYDTLLWGDLEEIYASEGSDLEKGRKLLAHLVKDWNLTNEEGQKLPINETTFNGFTADVINFLLSQTDIVLENKKKINE